MKDLIDRKWIAFALHRNKAIRLYHWWVMANRSRFPGQVRMEMTMEETWRTVLMEHGLWNDRRENQWRRDYDS